MATTKNADGRTIYTSIRDSIVFPTDVGDILDAMDVDPDIDITDIKNIPVIRAALEGDDSVYDMTDAEMQAELIEIIAEIDKENAREEALDDFSKCSKEDFDSILKEVIGDNSIRDILSIGNVYAIVSEHFNNEILDLCDDWNNDDSFSDAMYAFLEDQGACTILDAEDVYEILSEHFNNEILDRWIARQKK